MKTIDENTNLTSLIEIVEQAADTYRKVASNYTDNYIEHFFENLAASHKGFAQKAGKKINTADRMPVKRQIQEEKFYNENSAIDSLLLCIDLERQILDQARDAVHNYKGEEKRLLCQQLTFSENALFEADQMLEEYE